MLTSTVVLLALTPLAPAASVSQAPLPEERPFQTIPGLTTDGVLRHLSRLDFYCEPSEEPPSEFEIAFQCARGQAPQPYYIAWLVGDKKGGQFLSLTVNSQRGAGGKYFLDRAVDTLIRVASLSYQGAEPPDVEIWIREYIEEPLATMERPEIEMTNPRTGEPFEDQILHIAGVLFRIVGMPNAPGVDIAVQGY